MPQKTIHSRFEVEKTVHSVWPDEKSFLSTNTSHVEKEATERLEKGWNCIASSYSDETHELILWWCRKANDKRLNEDKMKVLADHLAKRAGIVLTSSQSDVGETWHNTSYSTRDKIVSECSQEMLNILEQYF